MDCGKIIGIGVGMGLAVPAVFVGAASAETAPNGGAEQVLPSGGVAPPAENGGAQAGMTDENCVQRVVEGFRLGVVRSAGESAVSGAATAVDQITANGRVPSLPSECKGIKWKATASEYQYGILNSNSSTATGVAGRLVKWSLGLDQPLSTSSNPDADVVEVKISARKGKAKDSGLSQAEA